MKWTQFSTTFAEYAKAVGITLLGGQVSSSSSANGGSVSAVPAGSENSKRPVQWPYSLRRLAGTGDAVIVTSEIPPRAISILKAIPNKADLPTRFLPVSLGLTALHATRVNIDTYRETLKTHLLSLIQALGFVLPYEDTEHVFLGKDLEKVAPLKTLYAHLNYDEMEVPQILADLGVSVENWEHLSEPLDVQVLAAYLLAWKGPSLDWGKLADSPLLDSAPGYFGYDNHFYKIDAETIRDHLRNPSWKRRFSPVAEAQFKGAGQHALKLNEMLLAVLKKYNPHFDPADPTSRVVVDLPGNFDTTTLAALAQRKDTWKATQDVQRSYVESSRTLVIRLFDTLGVSLPTSVKDRLSVKVGGQEISLSALYYNIGIQVGKDASEMVDELALFRKGIKAVNGMVGRSKFDEVKAQVFHSYFSLVYGDNYSLDEDDVRSMVGAVDLDAVFKVKALSLKVGTAGAGKSGTRSMPFFWFTFSGQKYEQALSWDEEECFQFINFVRHLRGLQPLPNPQVLNRLVAREPLSGKIGLVDAYFRKTHGEDYALNPECLVAYLHDAPRDQIVHVANMRYRTIELGRLLKVVDDNPNEFIAQVLKARKTLSDFNKLSFEEQREVVLGLYATFEAEYGDVNVGLRGLTRADPARRYIVLSNGKIIVESAGSILHRWAKQSEFKSKGVYPTVVQKSPPGIFSFEEWSHEAREIAETVVRQWIANENITFQSLRDLRNPKNASGDYWDKSFAERLIKASVTVDGHEEVVYYCFRDLFEILGLNGYWGFLSGRRYASDRAVLRTLARLGFKDLPDLNDIDALSDDEVIDRLVPELAIVRAAQALRHSPAHVVGLIEMYDEALLERYGSVDVVRRFLGIDVGGPRKVAKKKSTLLRATSTPSRARPSQGEAQPVQSPQAESTQSEATQTEPVPAEAAEALTDAVKVIFESHVPTFQEAQRLWVFYLGSLRGWVNRDPHAALEWIARKKMEMVHPDLQDLFQRLYDYCAAYTIGFEKPDIVTATLLPHQPESVIFFRDPKHKRGLLADVPGMGKSLQAILVAEALKMRKVLWVTTNTNKKSVKEEILGHTSNDADSVVVLSGASDMRSQQLRELDGKKYIIINYEALRYLEETDPAGYAALIKEVGMVVVDETQLSDNLGSLQGKAIKRLVHNVTTANEEARVMLMSATPVQHQFDYYFNILGLIDPERFADTPEARAEFTAAYISQGSKGLLDLHYLLQEYMLRRDKETVFDTADPSKPLDQQGRVLPKQVFVSYEQEGGFEMSQAQADLYVLALRNFDEFAERYQHILFPDLMDKPEELQQARDQLKASGFRKLDTLFDILYRPEFFGLTENPRLAELKRQVKEALLQGQKPILWVQHQAAGNDISRMLAELSEELKTEYPSQFPNGFEYGRFDGSSQAISLVDYEGEKIPQREVDRIRFQSGLLSEPRVMIASFESGGVGLTLTSGNPAILYEQPYMPTRLMQAYKRNHRADGKYPRYENVYRTLVARFPAGFIDTIEDPEWQSLLRHGTVDEVLFHRLSEKVLAHLLALDGLLSEHQLKNDIRNELVRETSFNMKTKSQSKQAKGSSSLLDSATVVVAEEQGDVAPINYELLAGRLQELGLEVDRLELADNPDLTRQLLTELDAGGLSQDSLDALTAMGVEIPQLQGGTEEGGASTKTETTSSIDPALIQGAVSFVSPTAGVVGS